MVIYWPTALAQMALFCHLGFFGPNRVQKSKIVALSGFLDLLKVLYPRDFAMVLAQIGHFGSKMDPNGTPRIVALSGYLYTRQYPRESHDFRSAFLSLGLKKA